MAVIQACQSIQFFYEIGNIFMGESFRIWADLGPNCLQKLSAADTR